MKWHNIAVLLLTVVFFVMTAGTLYIPAFAGSRSAVDAYEVMSNASDRVSDELLQSFGYHGEGYTKINAQSYDGQNRSVYCLDVQNPKEEAGLAATLSNPSEGTYILSGYSKSQNVQRDENTEYYSYSLLAQVTYTDGDYKEFHTSFSYGTHDWEYREISFTLYKPAARMNVYVFLRSPATGTAYFDGISLRCINDSTGLSTFADMPVEVKQNALGQTEKTVLKTEDGLELGLGESEITSLKVNGIDIKNNAFSGFMVRDIADEANDGIYSFKPLSASKPEAFRAEQPTLGFGLEADYTVEKNGIKVTGVITDTTQSADGRALQLYYALPCSASGWKWGTNILTNETIATGKLQNVYKNLGDGNMSVVDWDSEARTYYPVTCIYNEDLGIAISVSMDKPAYWELEYNGSTGQYVLTYHLGITNEAPDAATFAFDIYSLDDPEWGFRSAMEKYTRLHPDYYEVRESEHGLWLAWANVENVPDIDDFGIKWKEIDGTARLNGMFELSHEIKGYHYIEIGDWWISNLSVTDESGIWAKIEELKGGSLSTRATLQAIATDFCKVLDINGALTWNPVNNAWCPNGAQVHINANPALPGEYNFYNLWYNDTIKAKLFDVSVADGATFDGIYLDEMSGWWLGNANFNTEHYKYTTVPLTYSPYYKKAMLHRASTTWEFVKALSDDLHSMNKTIFANKCPDKNAFYTPLIDVMGTEQTALSGTVYSPQSIEWLSTWRTLAYQKPFCILLSNDYDVFDHDMMEKYFNRCLAYAIFPSPCANYNDSEGLQYFTSRNFYYERDRDIFKTYMPVLKEISESGWEPVTYASVESDKLIIERYGNNDAEGIHFTVYNQTGSDINTTLNIDLDRFTYDSRCEFTEMITGQKMTLGDGTLSVTIPANSTYVFCIKDPNKQITEDECEEGNGVSGGTVGGGQSNNNQNTSNDRVDVPQADGATSAMTHITQNNGADTFKTVTHHLTEQLNNIFNKTTYPWTIALIVVDTFIIAVCVLLILLLKKKKQLKLSAEN